MAELEKVIRGLECCLNTGNFEECTENCPYFTKKLGMGVCSENMQRDALSLLKAQEPKPPRFAVTFDKIFYACDKCGKSLLVVANAEGIKSLDNMPKYCPECGQAVKWE